MWGGAAPSVRRYTVKSFAFITLARKDLVCEHKVSIISNKYATPVIMKT
jgi:hypothetical protein